MAKPKFKITIELTAKQLETILVALRNYSEDCLSQATRERWSKDKGLSYAYDKNSVDYQLGMKCQKLRQKFLKLKK